MSQSNVVEIDLDKSRQFRFGIFEARDACRMLSNIPGKGPVDTLRLLGLLATKDWDAWSVVLSEGLEVDEPGVKPDRALRYLQMFLDKDGDLLALSKQIRKAGVAGRVWDPIEDGGNAEGNARGTARPVD